jgi:hypothetical protein
MAQSVAHLPWKDHIIGQYKRDRWVREWARTVTARIWEIIGGVGGLDSPDSRTIAILYSEDACIL